MSDKLRRWLFHRESKQQHVAAFVLLFGSGLGLLASFMLSIESLVLAKNSHAVLNCDLSSALSCSAVANHWSAELLGFPNSFIGIVTLPVMVTIAVALLADTKFPKWFMRAAQLGVVAGLLFAAWMFYMSYFEIGVLCPWCLTLDVGMLLIFYGLLRYNVLSKNIEQRVLRWYVKKGYDTLALASVVALAVAAILAKFGSGIL